MTDEPRTSAPPSDDDFLRRFAVYEAHAAEVHASNKNVLFAVLSNAGIANVEVRFDGYGDSGQIEAINASFADDVHAELPSTNVTIERMDFGDLQPRTITERLADAVMTLCYALLGATHAGWENSAGAYGDFTFDVAARTITLDYNERYESSENYQHMF